MITSVLEKLDAHKTSVMKVASFRLDHVTLTQKNHSINRNKRITTHSTLQYYTLFHYTLRQATLLLYSRELNSLYCTVRTLLYYTIRYSTERYCTLLYSTVLYCTLLYFAVLHSTPLHSTPPQLNLTHSTLSINQSIYLRISLSN